MARANKMRSLVHRCGPQFNSAGGMLSTLSEGKYILNDSIPKLSGILSFFKSFCSEKYNYSEVDYKEDILFNPPILPHDSQSILKRVDELEKKFLQDEKIAASGTVRPVTKALNFGSSTFGRPTEEEDYQSEKVSSGENLEDEVYNKFFSKYEGACDKLKLDNSKLVNYKKNREYALGLLPIDVREKVSERTKRSLAKFATETNKKKASSFSLGEMEKSLKGLCFPDRLLRKAATIQKCVEQIILRQDPLISNALQEVGVRVVKVEMKKQAVAVIRWRSTRGPEYETAEKAKEISTYLSSISGRLRHAAQARLQMGHIPSMVWALDREGAEQSKLDEVFERLKEEKHLLETMKNQKTQSSSSSKSELS